MKKRTPQGIRCEVDDECLVENMHDGEEALRDHVSPSVGQNLYAQSSHAASISGHGNASSSRVSKDNPLQNAFDKQSMLELHLKWTQAFMACGISFNVIQNPIFQDALMSTAKKGFVMPDYNKMRTKYVDKVKNSTEAILKRTVLDFIPMFGCTIALDGLDQL